MKTSAFTLIALFPLLALTAPGCSDPCSTWPYIGCGPSSPPATISPHTVCGTFNNGSVYWLVNIWPSQLGGPLPTQEPLPIMKMCEECTIGVCESPAYKESDVIGDVTSQLADHGYGVSGLQVKLPPLNGTMMLSPGCTPPAFTTCASLTQLPNCPDPCDDGAGGMLQSPGESCGPPGMLNGTPQCCAGLTCEGYSASIMGTCVGTVTPCPQPPPPNWVGLDTATLRNICITNDVNGSGSQSGVTLNRTCGVAFETWVLKTMGWLPRWSTLIESPRRQAQNASKGGLPGSVIPEQVLDQSSFMSWVEFPRSVFVEVKAVNGTLTLGTSQYQILGLLNVAEIAPAPDAGMHVPPAVVFITTSNTTISTTPQQVVDQATALGVAVWQQMVYYDASQYNPSANQTNPPLSLGDPTSPNPTCLNPNLYPSPMSYTLWPGPGPQNPLTWATDQEQDAVGAVPEPAPDSPAMVP